MKVSGVSGDKSSQRVHEDKLRKAALVNDVKEARALIGFKTNVNAQDEVS